jgi:hypothetical protein
MSDPERKTFEYRILRYAPNLLRDELEAPPKKSRRS